MQEEIDKDGPIEAISLTENETSTASTGDLEQANFISPEQMVRFRRIMSSIQSESWTFLLDPSNSYTLQLFDHFFLTGTTFSCKIVAISIGAMSRDGNQGHQTT